MLHHVRARRPSFNFQLARVAATARLVRRRRVSSPTARLPRRIDKDNSGTLEKPEIVKAVKEDKVANAASYDRAPFNLRGLVICGTAVFVCWCVVVQEQPNDRVTLRAVRRTSSTS